jgi:threonine dehydrogenase-like Zn-dependent dehydrogenase
VGICGSDLHWWGEAGIGDSTLDHPLVLGHEAAGVIADGPRAIGLAAGKRADMSSLVTARYPLAEAADAFRGAAARTGLKAVIEPTPAP